MQHPCYSTQYANGTYTSIDGYDYLNMQKYPTTLADFGGTFSSLCADSTVGFPQTQEEHQVNPTAFCDTQIHVSLPNSSTSYYKVQMSLARRGQASETEPENDNCDGQTDTTPSFLSPNSVTNECSEGYELDVVPNTLDCSQQQQLAMTTSSQLSAEDESSDIKPDSSQPNSEDDLKEVEAKLANETEKTIAEIKPPLSYIALIGKAILESTQQRLSLGSIYTWIEKNYPFYKNRGQGWRNSVRHNLSLNDCFIKAGRCEDGKGNYWSIHPANLQDFMRGDFRQRRRSRRRGRKRDCEYGFGSPYTPPPAPYYGNPPHAPVSPTYHTASSLSSIYSPYSEAERRAYRLDEVLLKQSMNNPFIKWYNNGACNSSSDFYSPNSAPANYDMYNNNYANTCSQWQSTNYDYSNSQMYSFSPSFSRYVK